MSQPAVIASLAQVAGDFGEAAPGHRFNLYFPIWRQDWGLDENAKTVALKACTRRIPEEVGRLLAGVRARQESLFELYPDGVQLAATSSAPFATGLGNEHPVENGFAFLSPYGFPYLAGSGVKGVLRRAAEEMALFPGEESAAGGQERVPLTLLDVWWLFGFEGAAGAWWPLSRKEERDLSAEQKEGRARWRSLFTEQVAGLVSRPDLPHFIRLALPAAKEQAGFLSDPALFLRGLDDLRQDIHTRGALDFWDVFPVPPSEGPYANRLAVEIMTPHFAKYYQGKTTPHDAGQPTPIPFLAVPAGSTFDFRVVCRAGRLPTPVRTSWRPMLEAVFAHAFEWLGFGAKTAVGYGQMTSVALAARGEGTQERAPAARVCAWVDQQIDAIVRRHNAKPEDVLRGKQLAEAWQAIEDPALKAEARADIERRWREKGWWESPLGKAAKQAKGVYEGGST